MCAFIDAEHALDTDYARRLGVELEDLLVSQPDCGEQALEIADTLVRTGAIDLIVVDSVAALTPRAEIEGDMGDAHMGLQARLMSQALRKLTAVISKTRTTVDLHQPAAPEDRRRLRQPRDHDRRQRAQVLLLGAARHPAQEGDQARRGDHRQRGARSRSSRTSCAPPFREAEFEILYGTGINKLGELVDTAEKLGLVEKSGTWYSYGGEKIGQGRDKVLAHLDEHPALAAAAARCADQAGAPGRHRQGEPGRQRSGAAVSAQVALLSPGHASQLLERVIYEQVRELVDLDALYELELMIATELGTVDAIGQDEQLDISRAMIDRALIRLAEDDDRYAGRFELVRE